jgi:hypothetical protein
MGYLFAGLALVYGKISQPSALYILVILILINIPLTLIRKEFLPFWNGEPVNKLKIFCFFHSDIFSRLIFISRLRDVLKRTEVCLIK